MCLSDSFLDSFWAFFWIPLKEKNWIFRETMERPGTTSSQRAWLNAISDFFSKFCLSLADQPVPGLTVFFKSFEF